LERRITEGNVGTFVKNDAIPKETNTTKDNLIEVQPEPSIPQTSIRGEERYCI